jgi:hypothetical protein
MEILPMIKFKFALLAMFLAFAGLAQAAIIDFSSSSDMTNANTWSAGSDSTGRWYGSNYSVDNGYAQLNESAGIITNLLTGSGMNSMVYAVSLANAAPGTYSWSMDTRYSFLTQFNYGQVYLLKDGQSVNLQGYVSKPSGSALVSFDSPGLLAGNGKWHTFGDKFTITANQLSKYDVAAFVFTASKTDWQTMSYDNFTSDLVESAAVPEPATIAFLASGALLALLRREKK